jgi:hypothetical protein
MSAFLIVICVLGVPLALGALVVRIAGVEVSSKNLGFISLALPIGIGLSSLAAFVSLVIGDRISIAVEAVLIAVALVGLRHRRPIAVGAAPASQAKVALPSGALVLLLGVALGTSALAYLNACLSSPSGGWDAWAFWNLRARFFARGGEFWSRGFTQLLFWTHPEYPVLVPAAVARGWVFSSTESPLVPWLIASAFAASTLGLLFFTLRRLRSRDLATLGALVLLGTPYFVLHGASQYSDVPVGYFFLATFSTLALHDENPAERRGLVALSGLTAGLAAFTKNEGAMFLACALLARAIAVGRRAGRAELFAQAKPFGAGLVGPLAVLVVEKLGYAARPPLSEFKPLGSGLSELAVHFRSQLTNGRRYAGLLDGWRHHLFHFDMAVVPILLVLGVYAAVVGLDPARRRLTTASLIGFFVFEALGTSAVFLWWSTLEIHEHVDALNRLLLQQLPSIALGVLLATRDPFAATSVNPR